MIAVGHPMSAGPLPKQGNSSPRKGSLLEEIEEKCNVDVDDVSTELIKSIPFVPHNQTSNQAVITAELLRESNATLLEELVQKYGGQGWEKVYDVAAVHFCARNIPFISGRVLVQISPRHVNDREAILRQCRSFAQIFQELGVSRDRFAIKLPFTGASASAAQELNKEGIRTLATTVFSLEQAIAASQSNCLFISPYFNEIAAHFDVSRQWDVPRPEIQHPMSPVIVQILETYAASYRETGLEQPTMIIASHVNTKEVVAMTHLGCPHITISAANLRALMMMPAHTDEESLPSRSETVMAAETSRCSSRRSSTEKYRPDDVLDSPAVTDYTVNGGEKLDEFLRDDKFVKPRFQEAMDFFIKAEETARLAISGLIEALDFLS